MKHPERFKEIGLDENMRRATILPLRTASQMGRKIKSSICLRIFWKVKQRL
jgi:hypothetical protein